MDYLRKEGNVAVAVTGREQEFADAKIAALHYRILEEINDPSPLALADVTIGTGRFIRSGCRFATCGISIAGRYEVWNGSAKRGDACAEISRRGTMRVLSGTCPSHFREKMGFRVVPKNPAFAGFAMEELKNSQK